ncbi:MAG: YraN family protein [Pseudomonadota bacterium]
MTPSRADRQRAEAAGRWSELLAGWYLRLKGFSILERRYKAHGGEIDIIARRGKLIVFAEVKTRQSMDDAINAISARNRRRIITAADLFIARHPHLAQCDMRYDIIAIAGWRLKHMPQAWRSDD